MEWSKAEQEEGKWKVPGTWVQIHYYEALNLLFRVENSVRVFVYCVLKDELGLEWSNAAVSTDDQEGTTIAALGKKRLRQAKQFGYLGDISSSPLLYLSLGELVQLIFSDAYWKLFATHFPGKKDTMRLKLDEIITIRNSLAHFRALRVDDVEVIRQNAKHALMGIERYLAAVTQCDSTVPSNSVDAWYKALKPLGTEHYAVELKESADGNWLSIRMNCRPPVLKSEISERWLHCQVIRINSANILNVSSEIRTKLIFLTESKSVHVSGQHLRYSKTLNFVFSRKAIEENYIDIAEGFKAAILKLSEETELLRSDDLARGTVLVPTTVYGWKDNDQADARWSVQSTDLAAVPKESDPSEYWGDLGWFGSDFVTDRDKYPWMSSSVSASGWF